mmetsp:Transcript_76029/g.217778  ORF Transcript_76029/g.217778 Transcript_76029/m.217778 type:complete len:228 (-) Transcript_76029:1088-1771(-)
MACICAFICANWAGPPFPELLPEKSPGLIIGKPAANGLKPSMPPLASIAAVARGERGLPTGAARTVLPLALLAFFSAAFALVPPPGEPPLLGLLVEAIAAAAAAAAVEAPTAPGATGPRMADAFGLRPEPEPVGLMTVVGSGSLLDAMVIGSPGGELRSKGAGAALAPVGAAVPPPLAPYVVAAAAAGVGSVLRIDRPTSSLPFLPPRPFLPEALINLPRRPSSRTS